MQSEKHAMRYRIGIDIGTTNLKAVLFDDELNVLYKESQTYKTTLSSDGKAEQDIHEVYAAFKTSLVRLVQGADVESEKIVGINFSSAMHSLILEGENGKLLTPNIIWSDHRSGENVRRFKEEEDWLKFYHRTGIPAHPMSPFSKLLWFKERGLLEGVKHIYGIKEYIIYQLSRQRVMDYSIGTGTGLMNIHTMDWDPDILDYLGLDKHLLPELVDVTYCIELDGNPVLRACGLNHKIELVVGASDGGLANLGAGVVERGKMALTIGTSGAIRMTVKQPFLDELGRTFCYYLCPGKWVIGGAVNNGGNVIDWLNDILFTDKHKIYELIEYSLETVDAGSNGLVFLPYLHGERAPLWESGLSASYSGIKAFHRKEHFIRATLEGILMNINNVKILLEKISGETDSEIYATGGFTNSSAWVRLITHVFGQSIWVTDEVDHSCLGAVLLSHLKQLPEESNILKVYEHDPEEHEKYRELQQQFNQRIESILGVKAEF